MSNNTNWRPKHSVKIRLIFIQAVLTSFLVIILAAFLYVPTRQSLGQTSTDAYYVLTNNLVATVFSSLSARDNSEIIAAAKRIEGVKGVAYVLVQDEKNKVVYDTLNKLEGKILKDQTVSQINKLKNVTRVENSRENINYYEYAAPFLIKNEPAAIVRIAVPKDLVQSEFEKLRFIFIRTSIIVLLIGIIVSFLISSKITAPIRKLTESALAIRAGNLNINPEITTNDEMEQLAREFRRMVDQLKAYYLKEVHEKEKAISDVKRIQEINDQLKDLDQRKNEFLSIASHQLRTPLSVILWTVSIIKEKVFNNLEKTEQKMLLETEKNAKLMESLIGELLDLTRMQKGTRQLTIQEIDIVDFAQQIFKGFETIAKKKSIQLSFEKGSVPIEKITSDPHALRHIISNLMDNAIRYTPEKGMVKLRLDNENDKVIIRVQDSGIGFNDDEKKNLFKQFTRGSRATKISPDGSGLGLYLVKQLVTQLGGTITLETITGSGSAFIIELPKILSKAPAQLTAIIKEEQIQKL